jgi:hypothetical protein
LEQFHQVIELTMDISTDSDGWFNILYIAFLDKNLLSSLAQSLHFSLLDVLTLLELLNPLV